MSSSHRQHTVNMSATKVGLTDKWLKQQMPNGNHYSSPCSLSFDCSLLLCSAYFGTVVPGWIVNFSIWRISTSTLLGGFFPTTVAQNYLHGNLKKGGLIKAWVSCGGWHSGVAPQDSDDIWWPTITGSGKTQPFTLISHMHHNLPGLQCHEHKPHPVQKPIPSKLLIRKGHIFNLANLNFKTQLLLQKVSDVLPNLWHWASIWVSWNPQLANASHFTRQLNSHNISYHLKSYAAHDSWTETTTKIITSQVSCSTFMFMQVTNKLQVPAFEHVSYITVYLASLFFPWCSTWQSCQVDNCLHQVSHLLSLEYIELGYVMSTPPWNTNMEPP